MNPFVQAAEDEGSRKKYSMQQLIKTSSLFVWALIHDSYGILVSSTSTTTLNRTTSSTALSAAFLQKSPATVNSNDTIAEKRFFSFCEDILVATELSDAVLFMALRYVGLYTQMKSDGTVMCEGIKFGEEGTVYLLFIVALIIANKTFEDNPFTNKTWSQVSKIPVEILTARERDLLCDFRFRLLLSEKDYLSWQDEVIRFVDGYESHREQLKELEQWKLKKQMYESTFSSIPSGLDSSVWSKTSELLQQVSNVTYNQPHLYESREKLNNQKQSSQLNYLSGSYKDSGVIAYNNLNSKEISNLPSAPFSFDNLHYSRPTTPINANSATNSASQLNFPLPNTPITNAPVSQFHIGRPSTPTNNIISSSQFQHSRPTTPANNASAQFSFARPTTPSNNISSSQYIFAKPTTPINISSQFQSMPQFPTVSPIQISTTSTIQMERLVAASERGYSNFHGIPLQHDEEADHVKLLSQLTISRHSSSPILHTNSAIHSAPPGGFPQASNWARERAQHPNDFPQFALTHDEQSKDSTLPPSPESSTISSPEFHKPPINFGAISHQTGFIPEQPQTYQDSQKDEDYLPLYVPPKPQLGYARFELFGTRERLRRRSTSTAGLFIESLADWYNSNFSKRESIEQEKKYNNLENMYETKLDGRLELGADESEYYWDILADPNRSGLTSYTKANSSNYNTQTKSDERGQKSQQSENLLANGFLQMNSNKHTPNRSQDGLTMKSRTPIPSETYDMNPNRSLESASYLQSNILEAGLSSIAIEKYAAGINNHQSNMSSQPQVSKRDTVSSSYTSFQQHHSGDGTGYGSVGVNQYGMSKSMQLAQNEINLAVDVARENTNQQQLIREMGSMSSYTTSFQQQSMDGYSSSSSNNGGGGKNQYGMSKSMQLAQDEINLAVDVARENRSSLALMFGGSRTRDNEHFV